MSSETLKELVHARSFRQFTIHMVDGRMIDVPHPDFILVTPNGRTAVISTAGDRVELLDVHHITRVTTTQTEGGISD